MNIALTFVVELVSDVTLCGLVEGVLASYKGVVQWEGHLVHRDVHMVVPVTALVCNQARVKS